MKVAKLFVRWLWVVSISLTVIYILWKVESVDITLSASVLSDGEYRRFNDELARALDESPGKVRIRRTIDSRGSIETVDQVNRGAADIGLAQANCRATGNVASLAYVFREAVLLLSKASNAVKTPSDMKKNVQLPFKIATLPGGSQSRVDLEALMTLHGYRKEVDYVVVEGNYKEGIQRLMKPAEDRDSVDYAFFISGLGNLTLHKVAWGKDIVPVPLTKIEAFIKRHAGYIVDSVPEGFFGNGFPTYDTVATYALLVARKDLPEDVAYDLVKELHERTSALQTRFEYLDVRRVSAVGSSIFPEHPGAAAFFDRDKPSALVNFAAYSQPVTQYLVWLMMGIANVVAIIMAVRSRRGQGTQQPKGA